MGIAKKISGALRHPGLACQKAADRLQQLRFNRTVLRAYRQPHGAAHKEIMDIACRAYGLDNADNHQLAEAARQRISRAQLHLFEKGLHFDLGRCRIGFQDLVVRCESNSVLESQVYLYGFYPELPLFRVYEQHVAEGSVAIDVGANIGLHTLPLSRCAGPAGRVYAYEPRASMVGRLKGNLACNRLEGRVVIRNVGVAASCGTIPFNEDAGNFNQGLSRYDPSAATRIDVVSLDDDLSDVQTQISLIKIDVEGMELAVIQGAKQLLARHRPRIVLEYNSPPWTLDSLRTEIPYPVRILRLPNTFSEGTTPIDAGTELTGWNNLLIQPG